MESKIIKAQNKSIKELKKSISTFVSGHNKTRVIPLAIPTGWGKTRIAIQSILKTKYKTPPIVVIWPQKQSHISKEVWKNETAWTKKASNFNSNNSIPFDIKFLKTSKPGPKSKRHKSRSSKFKGTFYYVNNKFRGVKNELDNTKGPIIFIIDEWHTKKIIEKYEVKMNDMNAEEFWRDLLIGKDSSRKLFIILISATPIGETSHLDSIGSDESEDEYKKEITDALKLFIELTKVGNQRRKYNLHKIYPKVIKTEEKNLNNLKHNFKYIKNKEDWIDQYICLSKKAYSNEKKTPNPPSMIYPLESLLNSGVTHKLVKRHFRKLAKYFRYGFSKRIKTLKLVTLLNLLKFYPNKKFVVFCHYKAIAHNLQIFLEKNKIPSYYLEGDINSRNDDKFHKGFNEDSGKIKVLIVTDKHSQGVSLHKSKAWLIHFELCWNPIRIIQRFGRVWRIDERRKTLTKPHVFYIPHSFSSEEEMISRLKRRWDVLSELSLEETNFINLIPIAFNIAMGFRCSPSLI